MSDKEKVVNRLLDEHDKCIDEGFGSAVEFKKLLNYEQGEGGTVEILFEEICENCGKELGEEIHTFKYVGRREV